MSDNYEDYSYEDQEVEKKAVLKKRIIIGILLVISIIIIVVLLKSCSNKKVDDPKPVEVDNTYEKALLEAGKKYYEFNEHKMPKDAGACAKVDLTTLSDLGLLNVNDFKLCKGEETYVQVCMVEGDKLQWTPWLTCEDKDSNYEYDEEKEGTVSDLIVDESFVRFMFLPQTLTESEGNLGPVEELWKEDIKYAAYKTLKTITYYSYKDQSWIWNTVATTYYTSKGDKTNSKDVNEYYPTTPNPKYNLSDSKATAYKWYTDEKVKEYYMKDGQKAWATAAPQGYPYKGTGTSEAKQVYIYRTRTATSNTPALHYYRCKIKASDSTYVDQQIPCQNASGVNTQNPSYTFTVKEFYGCPPGTAAENSTIVSGTICHTYTAWVASTTECKGTADVCQRAVATYYNWYKLVGGGPRTYYPSGSDTAAGEKIYYVSAPTQDAVKDETTATTAYKWYYKTEGQTSTYVSESPGPGATKTDNTKWSDWTDYVAKEPAQKSYRTIRSKVKIQLREIKGTSEDSWKDLITDYVTEEDLIKTFVDAGYEVTSLADINNNGNIRYKIKMLIRNKKAIEKEKTNE